MSLYPLTFLHWHRVMQIFREGQVAAGAEAQSGDSKGRSASSSLSIWLLLKLVSPPQR